MKFFVDHYRIAFGIGLCGLSLVYLAHTIKRTLKIKKGDTMRCSNFIKIYAGILMLFSIGLIIIYRELV